MLVQVSVTYFGQSKFIFLKIHIKTDFSLFI